MFLDAFLRLECIEQGICHIMQPLCGCDLDLGILAPVRRRNTTV